jgi:hypothetical protein
MNNTAKVILGFLVGALLTCVLIAALGLTLFRATVYTVVRGVQAQPGEAAQVSAEIADITVPEGYAPSVATRFAHFELVGYDGPDGHSHLYLFQLPPAVHVDHAELERQLQNSTGAPAPDGTRPEMQIIAEQSVTIRGETTTLVISEGTNHAGDLYRSASAAFTGNDGQALVSFSGLSATWDQAMVDDFLASMR